MRQLSVIWCDDIRQEVGNKPSFMGVYTGGLVLPRLPLALPRLFVWFHLTTPVDRPIARLRARVVADEEQTLIEMPDRQVDEPPSSPPEGRTTINYHGGLLMSPLLVAEATKYFQAVVTADGEEIRSHKLWIDVNPDLLRQTGIAV